MAWIYLILAGLAEIGWPLGFKLASGAQSPLNYAWIIFAAVAMTVSGILLYMAQREIPIGTAYIVWTGIGGIGTFLLGIVFFNEVANLMRYGGVMLIVSGIILLKFA